jgi:hypothetical protein
MTSYNSFTKQLIINQINLPNDLLNEIKSFCFYDIKSWKTIIFIKSKKRRIHDIFEKSTISRANPYDFYLNDAADSQENWVFKTFDEKYGNNNIQIQAVNCKHCGNYKIVSNLQIYTDRIICQHIEYNDNDNLTVTFEDGEIFEYDSEDDYSFDD